MKNIDMRKLTQKDMEASRGRYKRAIWKHGVGVDPWLWLVVFFSLGQTREASTSSKGNTVTQSNINHASESLIQAREEAHYHMFNYSQDAQYQSYLPGYGDNLVPSYGSSHPFMSMNHLVQQPEEQMSRNLLANPTFHLPHNHYDR
ncbi:Uncharacterized protein Fot_02787 [Forsythia ovata]|uniref:Uncharacterized protein n=1 Tax=Forsythia ovata TaxID=205694 RepID=A0ABD1XAY1_9LAMI